MSDQEWLPLKAIYCEHVSCDVSLEARVIYPAEFLPDQNPRVIAHRCSRGTECNLYQQAVCLWAGTNPDIDPFADE